MSAIVYASDDRPSEHDLLTLYGAVGWSSYTRDPERLVRAVHGSHHLITARDGHALIGLIRTVSDGATIAYIQDLLVTPGHQRRGVGRALLTAVLERYDDIYQTVLVTGNEPRQLALYRGMGFERIGDPGAPGNAFLILRP
jgi:ribosomal protein S18 acetylase RimI-like enzyme